MTCARVWVIAGLSGLFLGVFPSSAEEKKAPLIDQFQSAWEESNPFKSKPGKTEPESSQGREEGQPASSQAVAPPAANSPNRPKSSGQDLRLIPRIGLGSASIDRGRVAGDLGKFSSTFGFSLGVLADKRFAPGPWSFESGIELLATGAKLESDADLSLLYMTVPVAARYSVAKIGERSSFFLKGGAAFSMLLSASVSSCTSSACQAADFFDDDGDTSFLRTSDDVGEHFKRFGLMAVAGTGADFVLMSDLIVDSVSFIPELALHYGILDVNQGDEFGSGLSNTDVILKLSLAFDF